MLVDACDWHYHSLNRALKEVVDFEVSKENHLDTYNGLPTKKKLAMMNAGCSSKIMIVGGIKVKMICISISAVSTRMTNKNALLHKELDSS